MTLEFNITDIWLLTVVDVLRDQGDYMTSSGRKYVNGDFEVTFTREDWDAPLTHGLIELQYKQAKLRQLERNYLRKEDIDRARAKLLDRYKRKKDFTSVAVSMFGEAKDSRSQGHCMTSIVVTYMPKHSHSGKPVASVDVFYRQTEVIKKFGADLIFLKEIVFPRLIPPEIWETVGVITFHFANIFFSALFIPILYPYISPEDLWAHIEDTTREDIPASRSFRRACVRYIFWPLVEDNPDAYKYRSRARMHALALHYMETGVVNRESLLSLYLDVKGKYGI